MKDQKMLKKSLLIIRRTIPSMCMYMNRAQYVYVGYTPGYMGCYVYGPTIVYGTGFYYRPWYRTIYYPRQ